MIPSYEQFEYISAGQEHHSLNEAEKHASEVLEEDGKLLRCRPGKNLKPPKKILKRFWKQRENKLYLEFLEQNENQFAKSLAYRTESKLNFRMSSHIKFKNAKQCRSHHQKMLIKCKDIRGIINFLKRQLKKPEQAYQQKQQDSDSLEKVIFEQYPIYLEEWSYISRKNWPHEEDSHLE